jgi:CO/xanthine dehydrogenase FAD-binding subunit
VVRLTGTENGKVTALRVALTGTHSCPFLLEGTEPFINRFLDGEALQLLEKIVQEQVLSMRTATASHYRRLAVAGLARRLAADLFSGRAV